MAEQNKILILEQAESTNTLLLERAKANRELPQLYSIVAREQTAGRGQRGSSWEVKAGENLTFSFLIRSAGLLPKDQYAVSEFAAYGVMKTLARYLPEEDKKRLSIKWPNDIYYDNSKIAGILIEHSITGTHIDFSVVGIGINLNETEFPEHLPNPISLKQITGQSYDIEEVHARLMKRFGFMLEPLLLGNFSEVHQRCKSNLYRRHGLHQYQDANGIFWAEVRDLQPTGELVLLTQAGELRSYHFKEVSIIL